MPNLIKDKVAEMVKRQVKPLEGTVLEWPDHSIPFLGSVAAGSSKIEVRDIDKSETCILIRGRAGTRWFKVKVTETY